MIDIDVRRAMEHPDHPGLRIAGRFVGLDKYADLLSRYLPHVKDQERLLFMAQLRRRSVREHVDQDELEPPSQHGRARKRRAVLGLVGVRRLLGTFGVMVQALMHRSIMPTMQLATGTVVGGKVVVEGDPLPEGAIVTILAREADETFEVPPELEAELLESIAQADRGETISAEEMLERLRRIA